MLLFLLICVFIQTAISRIPLNERIDCDYFRNLSELQCKQHGCIWSLEKYSGPKCYLDPSKIGYRHEWPINVTTQGIILNLTVNPAVQSVLPTNTNPVEKLKFEATYLTDRILRIRITDLKTKRYEVPIQSQFPLLVNKLKPPSERSRVYNVDVKIGINKTFRFAINRRESDTTIWDTSIGGLIFTDQMIQISSRLPTSNVFGFGENIHQSFKHPFDKYRTFPMFSKDTIPIKGQVNLYGVHAFYMCLDFMDMAHGVFLLNSNAMEYTLTPAPALTLKTFGGILDFFYFFGQNPEHVVQLYTSLVGRPFLPPIWGLGFQLSRYGYYNTSDVEDVMMRNIKAKIPMDVQYMDVDYMKDMKDFTLDRENFNKLGELMNKTKKELGLRWTLTVSPPVIANESDYAPFHDGYNKSVYVKWPKEIVPKQRKNPKDVPVDRAVMYGRAWPTGPVAFPDFFKSSTKRWWNKWLGHVFYNLDLKFDAIWTDMNEPMNFNSPVVVCPTKDCYNLECPKNKYDDPPIKPMAAFIWKNLSYQTLCMSAVQGNDDEYRHYNVHSLYGHSQHDITLQTVQNFTGKRGYVLSRSTFASSGTSVAHWLGDNQSVWKHLHLSIIGILEFNLFGVPWTGADICGFLGNATAELCLRWSQLGAFYPFARNHNSPPCQSGKQPPAACTVVDQDPAAWSAIGHPEVTEAARLALETRYQLIAYLYTLFYNAHSIGSTVARPMVHEFPTDNKTWNIDTQFMWGKSILISPFLFPNQKHRQIYLPKEVWYYFNGTSFVKTGSTGNVTIKDNGRVPIHIRGGSIIPMLPIIRSTKQLWRNGLSLQVFPRYGLASGELFVDDGEAFDSVQSGRFGYFEFSLWAACNLYLNVRNNGFDEDILIKTIVIYGTTSNVVNATVDGIRVKTSSSVANQTIINASINLNKKRKNQKWVVEWKDASTGKCNL